MAGPESSDGGVRRLRWELRAPSARASSVSTAAGLLKGVGRVVLWCVAALLLLRGAADLLAVDEPMPAARESTASAAVWPDDEARAFALGFARAYLSWSPGRPERYARGVRAFVSPELAGSVVPQFSERAPRQVVEAVTVARTARVDGQRALVTVAVAMSSATRFVAVPVARDGRGGLVVYDLPSFAAPPARGEVGPARVEPLTGVERAEIEDVLKRFFRVFLAGRSDELEYLVPAGVRLGALGRGHALVDVVSLALAQPAAGRSREVMATVRARDVQTRAVYQLRYRLRLVRGDRWYVAAVNAARKGQ